MLAPQTMRGTLGAPDARFRVLLCRATTEWCGRHWTGTTAQQVGEQLSEREAHEGLCRIGINIHPHPGAS